MKNYLFYIFLLVNIYESLSFVPSNFYKITQKSKSSLNLNKNRNNLFDLCENKNERVFNYNITVFNKPEIVYYEWLNFIWYNYYTFDIVEGDLYGNNSIRQFSNLNQKIIDVSYPNYIKYKEVELFNSLDIGVMPLPEDEWTKGKCGMKGLLYMSVGIPAVMSNIGMNKDIINHGVNGFLPKGHKQWLDVLSNLIEDSELREKIGKEGRKTVEEKYSKEKVKKTYLNLYNSLMK